LTAFVNLRWAIGQLLSSAILKGSVTNTTQWRYVPFLLPFFHFHHPDWD
jgi:SP family general alpha glucoside:H+ symporter-like MFS transporter